MLNPFGNPFTPFSEDADGFDKFIEIMQKANTVIYGGWFIYFCAKTGANAGTQQAINKVQPALDKLANIKP